MTVLLLLATQSVVAANYDAASTKNATTTKNYSSPVPHPRNLGKRNKKKTNKKPKKRYTKKSTKKPTKRYTKKPTKMHTKKPTEKRTKKPTKTYTKKPAKYATPYPTPKPTYTPVYDPTSTPVYDSTYKPISEPTNKPTYKPTYEPTYKLTSKPTEYPVEGFPPAGNYYMLPDASAGDVRGPCPAINTLANHGFINRSGKEVLMTDLIIALSAVYDVTKEFLMTPVEGAIANDLTTLVPGATSGSTMIEDHMLDISDLGLRPGRQEHDASLVRTDSWFCDDEESKLANDGLIDALIAVGGTSKSFLTVADIVAFQRDRINDTLMHNGDPVSSTLSSIGGITVQKVLIMIFGQDEVLDSIDKARLEQWLRDEAIPDGYVPNPDRKYNPLNPMDLAFTVRAEFTERISETINEFVVGGKAAIPANSRCLSENE